MANSSVVSYAAGCSIPWVKPLLLVGLLAMAHPVMAAVQLDDQELDQNYLKGDAQLAKVDVEEVLRHSQNKQLDQILFTFVPVTNVSTLSFLLDDYTKEQLLSSDPFRLISSTGEVAYNNLGSEFYSYRWSGNYDRIFDLAQYQNFYFNDSTGSYEISNIRGRLDVETVSFNDNRRADFFRSTYVF